MDCTLLSLRKPPPPASLTHTRAHARAHARTHAHTHTHTHTHTITNMLPLQHYLDNIGRRSITEHEKEKYSM